MLMDFMQILMNFMLIFKVFMQILIDFLLVNNNAHPFIIHKKHYLITESWYPTLNQNIVKHKKSLTANYLKELYRCTSKTFYRSRRMHNLQGKTV